MILQQQRLLDAIGEVKSVGKSKQTGERLDLQYDMNH